MADLRVDSIVSIAGDAYLFGQDSLASVEVPVLAIGGTADTGTPWAWGTQLTFDGVGSTERGLVGLVGAEHMVAASSCEDMPFTQALPPEYAGYFCEDPVWDKAEAHDVIHHVSTACLKHTLTDDPAALAALDPEQFADDDALIVEFERE
jgi:predicted dienelactone hydrolase